VIDSHSAHIFAMPSARLAFSMSSFASETPLRGPFDTRPLLPSLGSFGRLPECDARKPKSPARRRRLRTRAVATRSRTSMWSTSITLRRSTTTASRSWHRQLAAIVRQSLSSCWRSRSSNETNAQWVTGTDVPRNAQARVAHKPLRDEHARGDALSQQSRPAAAVEIGESDRVSSSAAALPALSLGAEHALCNAHRGLRSHKDIRRWSDVLRPVEVDSPNSARWIALPDRAEPHRARVMNRVRSRIVRVSSETAGIRRAPLVRRDPTCFT